MPQLETGGSLQKIFNAAWNRFIVNDNPPSATVWGCKYLTPDGRKCAIGLCIPEGHEAQYYIGSFSNLLYNYSDLFPDLIDMDDEYLNEFQERLHDNLRCGTHGWKFNKEEMKNEYLAVAEDYNLTIPS